MRLMIRCLGKWIRIAKSKKRPDGFSVGLLSNFDLLSRRAKSESPASKINPNLSNDYANLILNSFLSVSESFLTGRPTTLK